MFSLSSPVLAPSGGLFSLSSPALGWMTTVRHKFKDARPRGRKKWWRKFTNQTKQWHQTKMHLQDLIMKQRLELPLKWAKELQQYAEELIYLAKRNSPHHNGLVESMLNSTVARNVL